MKARKQKMNQYNKWISLASLSLLSAAALQVADAPEVLAAAKTSNASSSWVQEGQSFKTLDEAMTYGSQHADWSKYKQYRVNYAGPNRFVLKWELKTPQVSGQSTKPTSQVDQNSEKPVETTKPAARPAGGGSYTIQSGDSLWRISRKYGVSIQDLMSWNNLDANYMLHPGDKLVVKAPGKAETSTEKPSSEASQESDKPAKADTTKVEAGWQKEDQSFNSVSEAMAFGRQHADWSKYKQYRVDYAGNGRYVLKWELRNPETSSEANEQKPTKPAESTTSSASYTVQSGDSLWRISNKYGVSIQDLMTWNKLGSNYMLHPGDKLVVQAPAKAEAPTSNPSTDKPAEPTKPAESVSYTVQSGDSLWRISHKYGVSIQDLMTWNKLGANYMLHPGDKLVVKAPAKAETPTTNPSTEKPAENTVPSASYTVQSGDSLWRISHKYGVSIQDLITWNKLGANYMLHPGDKLVVKAPAKAETSTEKPAQPVKVNTNHGFVREPRRFSSIQEALNYGNGVFNWRKYKKFYVNYAGPNSYTLDWELR
ncbi:MULTISPECIES: LysM peptidoglycan-binding domain-containing protein [Aerococcus]|uniref:LysM peptidoglycan-binding domain-containing protein n=2 Tax=Bacillati TaxID=1783272 RepID=A0ABT4BXI9_9LACT|nr:MULTISPECIES: LysM peptidoglycan-binding domain-containing protein [Aerococcus]KAA9220752.1 LysM peptidoglycan-binding domain-containing protein [Aerococcus loyolae]KAA9265700.1 LysM peptidoglycan-binding domain-containing protein [Aerococcus loyolae]MCY3024986.1 LysM peptidoglycan-binding domain-containing protein [Aerococcus loyolae]MCY3026958.1 LysM peptidoglycan-binding domain-containing protein [Aerococcus loyolae]MCY3028542.1 LysM peptidoglycan-binding domain-containing protein [Aeroc